MQKSFFTIKWLLILLLILSCNDEAIYDNNEDKLPSKNKKNSNTLSKNDPFLKQNTTHEHAQKITPKFNSEVLNKASHISGIYSGVVSVKKPWYRRLLPYSDLTEDINLSFYISHSQNDLDKKIIIQIKENIENQMLCTLFNKAQLLTTLTKKATLTSSVNYFKENFIFSIASNPIHSNTSIGSINELNHVLGIHFINEPRNFIVDLISEDSFKEVSTETNILPLLDSNKIERIRKIQKEKISKLKSFTEIYYECFQQKYSFIKI